MPETLEELGLKPFGTEPTAQEIFDQKLRESLVSQYGPSVLLKPKRKPSILRDIETGRIPGVETVTPLETPPITPTVMPPPPITQEVQPTQPTTPDSLDEMIVRRAKSLDIVLPDTIREKLKESIRRTNKWGLLFEAISSVGDILAGTPGEAQAYHGQLREKRKALLEEYDTEAFDDPLSNVSQKYQLIADEYYPQDWNKYSAKEITDLYPMLKDLLARQEAKISSERQEKERIRKGVLATSDKKIKFSETLRSEREKYEKRYNIQNYRKGLDAYGRMNQSWNRYLGLSETEQNSFSFVGLDQTIFVTFQKLLDPPSVVRESEYARTAKGIALISKIEGWMPRLKKGGTGVTDKDRQEIINSAKILFDVAVHAKRIIDSQIKNEVKHIAEDYEMPDWESHVSRVIAGYKPMSSDNKKRLEALRKKAKE